MKFLHKGNWKFFDIENMDRKTFLRQSSVIGAMALNPFRFDLSDHHMASTAIDIKRDESLMKQLVECNDKHVEEIVNYIDGHGMNFQGFSLRNYSAYFASMTASYCHRQSKFYEDNTIISHLEQIADNLIKVQNPDGTLDMGNLQSPPDTAFMLEKLCKGTFVLNQNDSQQLESVKRKIKAFILKAAETLAIGGIHTPNHRWAVSSVLAAIHVLYPDKKYLDRIYDWLGEGVFIDADGEYAERSKNYARVNNTAFIEIGRLLRLPSLFEPVRRNLEMTYFQMEPNGDLITNNSRRQDQHYQHAYQSITGSYLCYRYLAIYDNNSFFASIAKEIEQFKGFDQQILAQELIQFMAEPILQKELPAPTPLPVSYEKLFAGSSLVRIRRENISTTYFGGNDWPIIIASGRSHMPDFFGYRKGKAILRFIRFSHNFFNTGYFYSQGLQVAGNKYILSQKQEVPYYHPLPKEFRNPTGDYLLSPSIDGRFWSKMDFAHRPTTLKVLETTITMVENKGKIALTFNVSGTDKVPVIIELCFNEGGKISGVNDTNQESGNDNFFLEKGNGSYQFENDIIEFGPGILAHKYISVLEGEQYANYNGNLRNPGIHVYLTGVSPFEHTLFIS